jgi:carbon monoxide dehydrogenase subunit G
MQTVSLSRDLDAPPEAVREAMWDLEPFMRAGGFDEVTVDGDEVRLVNHVGFAELTLTLAVSDPPDGTLAYEQVDGVFESMRTVYEVTPTDGGCRVTATTGFALDVALVGDLLDGTIISRQRKREFEGQFDYLAASG